MEHNTTLLVKQDNITNYKIIEPPLPHIQSDQILVKIEKFAFSANNITYAALGISYKYFDFFPTESGFGITPVWGIGVVTKTTHPKIPQGERIYGYFPMSKYVVLSPSNFQSTSFIVSRPQLPEDRKVYNQYFFLRSDPFYSPKHEDHMMLFRPLFLTSFFLDDFLVENKYFGGKRIIISSASSKTSFALAFLLKLRHKHQFKVIGLTSKKNISYVKSLDCYTEVLSYEHLSTLSKEPTTFIDVAGSLSILKSLYNHLGDNLKISITVGMSHWDEANIGEKVEGVKGVLFFAPYWIKKRQEELGVELGKRTVSAWGECMNKADGWVRVVKESGKDGMVRVFQRFLDGKVGPEEGVVVSPWDGKSKL